MAAKAKGSSSSCLSFLKDALLLPTRNPKLFIPVFLLVAVSFFLLEITHVLLLPNSEVNNRDSSSPNYAKLKQILRDEPGFIKITISVVITICVIIAILFVVIAFVYGFAIQIILIFAASTTYSGDDYSLPELFSKVIMNGRRLRGPLITVVLVTVLEMVCKAPLSALSLPVMPRFYMAVALSALPFLVFLCLEVVSVVAIAVSVADTKRRGVSALSLAWWLMTRVCRKEGFMLVVVCFLVRIPSSPLHTVALAYSKKSMSMGLALLSVHALLSGLMESLYFTAATVYCYQAMKSKNSMEVMAP